MSDHRYDLLTPHPSFIHTEKNTKGADDDEADDRVQDRLAKHFDKRARRNRMLEEYGKEEEDETKRLYEEDNFCLKTVKVSTVFTLLGCFVLFKVFSHTLYYYDLPISRLLSATAEVLKQVILEVILELPKRTTLLPRSARLQIKLPTMPSLQLAFWHKKVNYPLLSWQVVASPGRGRLQPRLNLVNR